MKKFVLAAALAGFASAASAGSLAEPEVETVIIEETQQGSSGGIVLPLLLLVIVGAAIAAS